MLWALTAASPCDAQSLYPRDLTGYVAEAAQAARSLVQRTDIWGDWQGQDYNLPKPMPTQVVDYFYDNDNHLRASIRLTTLGGDSQTTVEVEKPGDQIPNEYITYSYDERGNMVKAMRRKYGTYAGMYLAWAKTEELLETNEYDEQNRLVLHATTSQGKNAYVWEGKNLVEQSDTTGYGNWTKATFYSDFLAGGDNLPQRVETVDRWGNKQVGLYSYDDQLRPVKLVVTKVKEATIDEKTHRMSDIVLQDTPYEQTEWSYDADGLYTRTLSYWNNGKQAFVPQSRLARTKDEDGGVRTTQYTYSTSKQDWAKNGSPSVDHSAAYTAGSAPEGLTAQPVAEGSNDVKLTADAPAGLKGDEIWKVYRNGVYAGRASLADGKLTYTDRLVKNGDWHYLLQRATAADTTGTNAALADLTLATALPAPTNLHITSQSTDKDKYIINLAWDAPVAGDAKLQGYNVYNDIKYYVTNPSPLNGTTLITDPAYTVSYSKDDDKAHTLYVEAVYEVGTSVRSVPVALMLGETPKHLLTTSSVMGDVMGIGGDDIATKVTTYYYDTNNRLVRETVAGRLTGDNPQTPDVVEKEGDYQVTGYKLYNYTEAGDLAEVKQMEYAINQGANMSWTAPVTLETYKYDDAHHCTEKADNSRTYKYAYDGDNLVKEEQYSTSTGNHLYTMVYSDFVEGKTNLPRRAVKDGTYSSNQRTYDYTYDEAGHLLSVKSYKFGEVERDDAGNIVSATNGTPDQQETWTYNDEGKPTLYLKQKWSTSKNDWVNSSKTEYEQTATGDRETTYSWTTGADKWTSGRPVVNAYSDYYTGTTPTAFKVSKVADQLNTVGITASAPYESWDSPTYHVYRNGINIGEAQTDVTRSKLSFTDATVENGTWDYFLMADTHTGNATVQVTTPVTVTFDTPLTPVTKVWSTSASVEGGNYKLSVAWEAPESDIPVKGYNIYSDIKSYTKNPAPDNDVNLITGTTYDYSWSTENPSTKDVYVEVVYTIGRVRSEAFKFDVSKLTAINEAAASAAGLDVNLAGRTLQISGTAQGVAVYDLTGRRCATYAAAPAVSLASLPAGTYVVNVTDTEGQAHSYKLVLK